MKPEIGPFAKPERQRSRRKGGPHSRRDSLPHFGQDLQPLFALRQSALHDHIGEDNLSGSLAVPVERRLKLPC